MYAMPVLEATLEPIVNAAITGTLEILCESEIFANLVTATAMPIYMLIIGVTIYLANVYNALEIQEAGIVTSALMVIMAIPYQVNAKVI